MDFIDPAIFKLIALCGVALIVKFWFDYSSGRSLPDSQHDDDAIECGASQCIASLKTSTAASP